MYTHTTLEMQTEVKGKTISASDRQADRKTYRQIKRESAFVSMCSGVGVGVRREMADDRVSARESTSERFLRLRKSSVISFRTKL